MFVSRLLIRGSVPRIHLYDAAEGENRQTKLLFLVRCSEASRQLSGRFEQLDRIAVGIFQLDLLPAGTRLDLVSEAQALF
jgi:hypothetical protein